MSYHNKLKEYSTLIFNWITLNPHINLERIIIFATFSFHIQDYDLFHHLFKFSFMTFSKVLWFLQRNMVMTCYSYS